MIPRPPDGFAGEWPTSDDSGYVFRLNQNIDPRSADSGRRSDLHVGQRRSHAGS